MNFLVKKKFGAQKKKQRGFGVGEGRQKIRLILVRASDHNSGFFVIRKFWDKKPLGVFLSRISMFTGENSIYEKHVEYFFGNRAFICF